MREKLKKKKTKHAPYFILKCLASLYLALTSVAPLPFIILP